MEGFSVLRWKEHRKGFLQGFADIQMPGGYIVRSVTVHKKNHRIWCNPPAKSYTKEDGSEGWSRVFDFADKETYSAWSDNVIAALRKFQAGDDDGEVPWESEPQREEAGELPF
jgi:hypothetical protein